MKGRQKGEIFQIIREMTEMTCKNCQITKHGGWNKRGGWNIFLKYLLHKQIIEMCHSQNLRLPLLVPCPTQCPPRLLIL